MLVLFFLTPKSSSAPTPGGGFFLEDLFLTPILGLGLGAAGGALATGVAGLAAAGAVAGKINTLANVANAKINLITLGSSLFGNGASLLGGGKKNLAKKISEYYLQGLKLGPAAQRGPQLSTDQSIGTIPPDTDITLMADNVPVYMQYRVQPEIKTTRCSSRKDQRELKS